MSSIKDLFGNKNNKVLPGKSLGDLVTGSGVESAGYIEKDDDNKRRFEPRVNFSEPSNFARYGSAEKYYEDAIDHISHHYPYDGSGKEKIAWHLDSSYFDNYIFENEYPRTNGYITLGLNYDFDTQELEGYDKSSRPEWISFRGGPHTASGGMIGKPLSTTFTGSNYYNDTNRESNLELDGNNGITLEFWINKQSFDDSTESRRQVIFDAWNNAPVTTLPLESNYGRFRVEVSGSGTDLPPVFHVELLSGTDGFCADTFPPGPHTVPMIEMTGSSLTGSWNHFALSFINTDTQMRGELYQNGSEVYSITTGTPMGKVTGSMFGRVGSLAAGVMDFAGGEFGTAGDAKLSASLDEVRFWKTKRTETEIGRYWFTQVNAGTNTDIANVDLGVYYKFNEGIVDTTSVSPLDTRVLDYSGRISNGSWTGYQVGSRFTGSAMVEAGAALTEFKDPIIYQSNPLVALYRNTKKNIGYDYDVRNNAGIYTSIPEYITGDPVEVEGETLKKLTQIMGSYFDSLQLQIEAMPRIKDVQYTSGSQKVAPFVNRFLEGVGLYAPEIFADAGALEYYASRDDFIEFSKKLSDTKNRLYENIYNNVVNIFKTKGTEESFRNLMRCYGVDEPLMKISLYGDEVTQELRTNTRNTAARKVFVDFNNVDRFDSTVYQQTASADTDTRNFITASSDMEFIPKTMQAEVIFPKKFKKDSELYFRTPFLSCSLFGAHTPITTDQTDLTWQTPDISNFQVYAVRTEEEGDDVYFQLTSSTGGVIPDITSSVFTNVYDNNKWNLAVRVKPEKDYAPGLSGSQWGSASVEFVGYNSLGDNVENNFYLTASIPIASGSAFLSSSTRIYVGAHRENFTGSQLQFSDAKISSTRYWIDNLPNEAIEAHSKDASSFGPLDPHKSAYLVKNSADFFQQIQAPQSKTLALSWTFDTVTGSGDSSTGSPTLSDATFFVPDMTSGSLTATSSYGWLGPVVNMRHPGKGDFFLPFDTNAVNREYVYSAKQLAPEILNSSNMIEVRTQDDNLFTRETRPQNYFYAIEKSQAAIISEEMMKWFATIKDFNFLIGDPVNRYRQEYKTLAQMRELYFRTVGNTMSFERFVEFFKWVDSALSEMLLQLVPASANFAEKVRTMIESHVLERSKYWSKFPTLEMKLDDPEAGLRGIVEGVYPWKRGHAPIPLAQDEDCFWWQHRATASLSSSGDSDIDAARDIYRLANDFRPNAKTPTLTDIATTPHTQYQGNAYALRNLTQPYLFKAKEMPELKGGSNVARIKNIQYAHTELPFGATTQLKVLSSEVESDIDCNDVVDPNDKVKLRYKLTNNPISYLSGKGNLFAPFDLFSSSVSSGYQAALPSMGSPAQKIALTNYHDDFYGNDKEIPMQGPFTEKYVGGWVHRHVPFPNTDCPSTGSLAEECRPEAWNLELASQEEGCVTWQNITNFTTTVCGGLWKNAGGLDWNSWASSERITVNDDSVTYRSLFGTPPHANQLYAGLHTSAEMPANTQLISYAFYFDGRHTDTVTITENGADPTGGLFWALNTTDYFRITRDKLGQIIYQRSTDGGTTFSTIYTSTSTTLDELYPAVAARDASILCGLTDATVVRTENAALTLAPRTAHQARSTILREPLAKRPVNIRNIKQTTGSTIIGNYSHEYEVLQTSDRKINNRFFVKNEGFVPEYNSSPWIAGLVDYVLPDFSKYGATKNIFVERFNAPGGPDVSSRGVLDLYSEQFAIGNDLNYRNMAVRGPLNEWSTEHCGQFGIKAGSSVNELNYDTSASYFKVNRNPGFDPRKSRPYELQLWLGSIFVADYHGGGDHDSYYIKIYICDKLYVLYFCTTPLSCYALDGSLANPPIVPGAAQIQPISIPAVPASQTQEYFATRAFAALTLALLNEGDYDCVSLDVKQSPDDSDWYVSIIEKCNTCCEPYIEFEGFIDMGTSPDPLGSHIIQPECGKVYDNWWVQHPIPRSEAQYAWIAASLQNCESVCTIGLDGSPNCGRDNFTVPTGNTGSLAASELPFITASEWGSLLSTASWGDAALFPSIFDTASIWFDADDAVPWGISSNFAKVESDGDGTPGDANGKWLPPLFNDDTIFTFSVWAKPALTQPHITGTIVSIFEAGPGNCYPDKAFALEHHQDGKVVAYLNNEAGSSDGRIISNGTYPLGEWYHYVLRKSGSLDTDNMELFIDGVLDNWGPAGTNESTGDEQFYIGLQTGSTGGVDCTLDPLGWPFSGSIDEMSLWWNWSGFGALSDAEVVQLYNNGCPGNLTSSAYSLHTRAVLDGDLRMWYRMGEGHQNNDPSLTPDSTLAGGYIHDVSPYSYTWGLDQDATSYFGNQQRIHDDVPPACSTVDIGCCDNPGLERCWGDEFVASSGWLHTDFAGMNYHLYEPIDSDNNFIGYPAGTPLVQGSVNCLTGTSTILPQYINKTFVPNLCCPSGSQNIPQAFNALMLNRNGPYGYPSWKQIRTGQTAVARYQKNNNLLTFKKEDDISFPNGIIPANAGLTEDTLIQFVEPPVTFRYRPLRTTLMLTSSTDPLTLDNVYGNNVGGFPNPDINNFLGTSIKCEEQMFDRLKDLYHNAPSDSPVSEMVTLNYNEVVYPREIHAGLKKYRQRTEYAEVANGTKFYSQGEVVAFSASMSDGINGIDRGPLYRRTFWRDRPIYRNRKSGSWTVDPSPDWITTLPNSQGCYDYQASSINGWGATPLSYGTIINANGFTLRDTTPGGGDPEPSLYNDFGELNSPNWITINGYVGGDTGYPGTNSRIVQTLAHPTASAYYYHHQIFVDFPAPSARIGFYSQRVLKWRVAELSGKNPWFDTYEDYVQDIRGTGKAFTIIPEFRISQHMNYYSDGMFRKQNDQILTLDGASITSSAQQVTQSGLTRGFDKEFFSEYSNTDFQKYFGKISSDNSTSQITLKCNGIKKLLPYHGFYPSHRTLQVASLFSQSVAPYLSSTIHPTASAVQTQTALQPFYAPGIMYNTIKSGIAVDWGAHTGSSITGSISDFGGTGYSNFWLTAPPNYRIPFESILNPLGDIGFPESASAGNGRLNLLYPTYHAYSGSGANDPFCDISPQKRVTAKTSTKYTEYQLAINNFLAELPNFFIEGNKLKTIQSKRQSEISMISGTTYYMDVYLTKNSGTVMIEDYLNGNRLANNGALPGHPITPAAEPLQEGMTNRSFNGAYFGPPTQAGLTSSSPQYTWSTGSSTSSPKFDEEWVTGKMGDPAYAPYTPPYFYGKSKLTIAYTADGEDEKGNFSYKKLFEKSTYTASNPEMELMFIKLGAIPTPVSDPRASAAYSGSMPLEASLNIKGLFQEKETRLDKAGNLIEVVDAPNEDRDRWVISPRMETPVLDFSNQEAEIGYGIGMWSGYGNIPQDSDGLIFGIEETSPDGYSAGSASLLQKCFENPQTKVVGEVATQKEISEAIVAIPFAVRGYAKESRYPETTIAMDKNFFKIDSDKFDYYRDWFMQNKNAEAKTSPAKPSQSIQKMLTLMDKYIIPPELDFLTFNQGSLKVDPFVMYLFEFNHTLSQQDLADIWQGVMPDISRIAQLSDTTVDDNVFTHATGPDEFYGGKMLPDDIRWMVFKVKKRANFDYFKMTADTSDDAKFDFKFNVGGVELPYSYNWPYDYCSLVELAELEVQEQFVPYKPVAEVAGEDAENPAITRFVEHFKAIATGEEEE